MPGMIARMFEWGDLVTVGVLIVLEGLLSADNAMVMAVMVLALPAREHHIITTLRVSRHSGRRSSRIELMNLRSRSINAGGCRDVPKMSVVLTGGILGIVAMRMVVGQLLTLIQKYPAMVDGAFIIIAWVGSKLLVEYLHAEGYIPVEIPQWLSLTVIVGIFVVSLVYARREAARHHVRHLEGLTAKGRR